LKTINGMTAVFAAFAEEREIRAITGTIANAKYAA
jgi:hypothetical protein